MKQKNENLAEFVTIMFIIVLFLISVLSIADWYLNRPVVKDISIEWVVTADESSGLLYEFSIDDKYCFVIVKDEQELKDYKRRLKDYANF